MITKICAGVSVALAFAVSAPAATVRFDNGSYALNIGGGLTYQASADDFGFASDTLINHVTFWTFEGNTPSKPLYYSIIEDNGGRPKATPVVDWTEATDVNRQATGERLFEGTPWELSVYAYNFKIAPFTASGGSTYWLALHAGPPSDTDWGDIYWAATSAGWGSAGYQNDDIAPNGWQPTDPASDLAFRLGYDENAPVPEPSAFSLLGLSLAALAGYRRFKS